MTLEEFAAHQVDKVQEFVLWWDSQHNDKPDLFPMDLPVEEWEEMLACAPEGET